MRNIFATSLLAIALLSPIVATDGSSINVNSDVIGPYTKYQNDVDISFTYTFNGSTSETFTESVYFINAVSNLTAYKVDYQKHTMKNKQSYSFKFPLKLHSNFGDSGAKIRVLIKSSKETMFDQTGFIKPFVKNNSEQLISDKNNSFKIEGYSFYFKDSKLVEQYDDFKFDLNNYKLDHNYFYKLDVSKISFSYNSSVIHYEEAYITYNDYAYCFPFMEHDRNNFIKIPLSLSGGNKRIYASLKKNYYVNPISYDISEIPKEGFIQTRYFLLPKNYNDYIDTANFTVHFVGLGFSKSNYRCLLRYSYDNSFFGNCMSSDYCVVGDYF